MESPSILLDGTLLLQKQGTGIASYTRTLARCLRSLGARVNLLFATNSDPAKHDPDFALATQVFCHRPSDHRLVRLALMALRSRFGLKKTIAAIEVPLKDIDLSFLDPPLPIHDRIFNAGFALDRVAAMSLWGTSMARVEFPEVMSACHWTRPIPLQSRNCPNLYTIHDLVPIQYPYLVIDRPGNSARLHNAIARTADGIITVSETSKAAITEILKVPPERITVTYQPAPTPSPLSGEDAEWLVSSFYKVEPYSYALYLGAVEPKKNLRRLIEAFLMARVDVPLLMAGPLGWLYDEEQALLASIRRNFATQRADSAVSDDHDLPVRYLGYLPRRHVTALLQCAKFFVFPSIYEGFGLPVLEAMQLGVPVLTSRTGSLCEVVGEAALLVDPLNIDDISRGIRQLDADGDLRAELERRGPVRAAIFSEEAYVQRLKQAYGKVGVSFHDKSNRTEPMLVTSG